MGQKTSSLKEALLLRRPYRKNLKKNECKKPHTRRTKGGLRKKGQGIKRTHLVEKYGELHPRKRGLRKKGRKKNNECAPPRGEEGNQAVRNRGWGNCREGEEGGKSRVEASGRQGVTKKTLGGRNRPSGGQK